MLMSAPELSALYSAKLPDKVVEARTQKSRYSSDMGELGHQPGTRPLLTSYGAMATTTQDLLLGTAKNSTKYWYSGHIPKGDGEPTLQPPRRDIKKSIKDTYNVNVSGYTGTIKTREVAITYATTSGARSVANYSRIKIAGTLLLLNKYACWNVARGELEG